jgi:hypothetical protein
MIFVLEVPSGESPHAWFAYDDQDLLNKVAEGDPLNSWEIHDTCTPRDLMELVGVLPGTPEAQAFPGMVTLAQEYGLDTALCRADYVLDRGCYQEQAVSVRRACEAALRQRVGSTLKDLRIYWSEEEAVLATEGAEPLFATKDGWKSLHALRAQLLSLDVLAEG